MNELIQILADHIGEFLVAIMFAVIRRFELPAMRRKIEARLRKELGMDDQDQKKDCTCKKDTENTNT